MISTITSNVVNPISNIRGSGAKAYFYLAHLLAMQGKISRSIKTYGDLVNSLANQQTNWSRSGMPEREYIINNKYGFIYCPIPKVACSSIKRVVVELSNLKDKDVVLKLPNDLFHTYVYHNLTLSASHSQSEAFQIIESDNYFKFAFVRNPWRRLLSAYLNKFVEIPIVAGKSIPPDNAREVIECVYRSSHLKPDYQQSISFRQFIEFILETDDQDLDGHWQSQISFLGNHRFDFIGRLENLHDDFSYIKNKLGISTKLPWQNKSNIKDNTVQLNQTSCYVDMYPKELRKMKVLPKYKEFYSAELVELVREKYMEDIIKFNYTYV